MPKNGTRSQPLYTNFPAASGEKPLTSGWVPTTLSPVHTLPPPPDSPARAALFPPSDSLSLSFSRFHGHRHMFSLSQRQPQPAHSICVHSSGCQAKTHNCMAPSSRDFFTPSPCGSQGVASRTPAQPGSEQDPRPCSGTGALYQMWLCATLSLQVPVALAPWPSLF